MHTPRNRRDKAFFALMMLTAARVSAALSLPLNHVDLVESCIQQDAREVATKFSKTFRTDFSGWMLFIVTISKLGSPNSAKCISSAMTTRYSVSSSGGRLTRSAEFG